MDEASPKAYGIGTFCTVNLYHTIKYPNTNNLPIYQDIKREIESRNKPFKTKTSEVFRGTNL